MIYTKKELKVFLDIIHGDIKPSNVLVFRNDADSFSAKVADFGYSTRFSKDDERIRIPRSRPWNAPEVNGDRLFNPSEARRTDIYSFGILCVWFLFEDYFTGRTPLPQESSWAEKTFMCSGKIG